MKRPTDEHPRVFSEADVRAMIDALKFYADRNHWMQITERSERSRVFIANGPAHENGDGWEQAEATLAKHA